MTRFMIALLAPLALAACQTGGPSGGVASAPAGEARSAGDTVGKTLTGEACRLVDRKRSIADAGRQPADLFCGKSQRAAGSLAEVGRLGDATATGEAAHAAILAAAGGPFAASIEARVTCQPGRWFPGAGGEIYLSPCALKDGGWPSLALTAARDGRVIRAEGIPTALPALEAAIDAYRGTGAAAADATSLETNTARLEQLFGGGANLFGAGDLDAFKQALELARLYDSSQRYANAERAYRQALDLQSKVLKPDNPAIGNTLANLALEVSNQGRADEAEGLFQRAEPLVARDLDATQAIRFTTFRALAAANRGDFKQALAFAQDASSRRRALAAASGQNLDAKATADSGAAGGVLGDPVSLQADAAHGYYLEAVMASRLNDTAGAEASITQALTLLDQNPSTPLWWRPQFLMMSADVIGRQGRVEEAAAQLRGALKIRRQLFGETTPTAAVLMALGRLFARDNQPGPAVDAFRQGVAILSTQDNAGAELSIERLGPYLDSLAALADARDGGGQAADAQAFKREMFRVAQLGRSGVTGETIARASARVGATDPKIASLVRATQEAERERDFDQIELAAETAKPDERRDIAAETELGNRLRRAAEKAALLQAQLQSSFPAYNKLATHRPATFDSVGPALATDEALATILFGRERSYIFLVRRDHVAAARLAISAEDVAEAVTDLRAAFTVRNGKVAPFKIATSHRLYAKLFGPIERDLEGARQLIYVPTGALLSLPPAVLVTKAPATGHETDYAHAAWLIERLSVSVAPSVQAFLSLRGLRNAPHATNPFLGVGNPAFVGKTAAAKDATGLEALSADCRTGGPASPELLRALAPLPETADEVTRVAAILGAGPETLLLGRDATEAKLRAKPLADYRVMYFATHGLLPGELKCQSEPALALSPPSAPATTTAEDGLLEASEVATLSLNADLVVLSACNTGGGGGKLGGEALSGLAEAFFYAGARSLMVSHWQVPSSETVRLMTGTFAKLGAGGAADALRRTQLDLAGQASTAHPFYWGAFTLIGDGATTGGAVAANQ